MDLPALIRARRARPGNSLRAMERRGDEAFRDGRISQAISRSTLTAYEHGRIPESRPGPEWVRALAAVLDCSFDEVAAAVEESYRLGMDASGEPWHVKRWRALTADRPHAVVEELLVTVEQVLRMLDRPRDD